MDFNAAMEGDKDVVDLTEANHAQFTPVMVGHSLDIEAVRKRFQEYEERIDQMHAQATDHKVSDNNSLEAAVTMASQAKAAFKRIDDLRKEYVADPNNYVKSINGFAKVYTSKLKGIEENLKSKISSYQYALEMERRKAEQRAREEARKLQEKINKEAAAAKIEPVQVAPQVIPQPKTIVRTEAGSASQRMEWKWEQVDFAQVPDEYKALDGVKINKAVRAGIREIAGIRIFEQPTTVLR